MNKKNFSWVWKVVEVAILPIMWPFALIVALLYTLARPFELITSPIANELKEKRKEDYSWKEHTKVVAILPIAIIETGLLYMARPFEYVLDSIHCQMIYPVKKIEHKWRTGEKLKGAYVYTTNPKEQRSVQSYTIGGKN